MVADENRQKQGKNVEKKDTFTFFVLSPLILHIINENTALLKEKEISFSPVPFNPVFFVFFIFFS
jgi:hypothetical protein